MLDMQIHYLKLPIRTEYPLLRPNLTEVSLSKSSNLVKCRTTGNFKKRKFIQRAMNSSDCDHGFR